MNAYSAQRQTTRHRPAIQRILVEAMLVTAVGVVLAFLANQFSPAGLKLTRNYFPADTNQPMVGAAVNIVGTNHTVLSPAELVVARMKELGLQLIDSRQAAQLFRDPRFQSNAIVFVDARDETRYREGHIPGAYEFDPYHPEKYFPTVLPLCQAAEQVVVYCNGGECDDSESAAVLLRDVGIANQKLFVYSGGITEWTTNGLPVETGGRNSPERFRGGTGK